MNTLESRAIELLDVDTVVADTCDLIRGRGENPGGTEEETVRRLTAMCERVGATVTLQELSPGRPNLHATIGPADGPAILFLGHSDVVPAGAGWAADPFEPYILNGAVFGRGTTDMKGGLAAVIAAMHAVATVAPEVRVELLCTVDEEDRSQGVRAWLATNPPRDYLACVVAEPTDLEIVVGCRGATNLNLEIVGNSAHAGRPEDGASSIYAAARIVELVRGFHEKSLAGERDPLLGTPTWNVGTISGGTGTSMVPRVTQLTVDRRTMPGEHPEAILEALLEAARADIATSGIANAHEFRVHGLVDMVMPGFRAEESSSVIRIAAQALTELEGTVRITGWTAACEGGFIANHHSTPTIIFGPGDINTQAHQPDERVSIDHLMVAARTYTLIALGLAEEALGYVTAPTDASEVTDSVAGNTNASAAGNSNATTAAEQPA